MITLVVRVIEDGKSNSLLWAIGEHFNQNVGRVLCNVFFKKEAFQGEGGWLRKLGQEGVSDAWAKSIHVGAGAVYSSSIECAKLNIDDMTYKLAQKNKLLRAEKRKSPISEIGQTMQSKKIHRLSQAAKRLEGKLKRRTKQLKENKIPITLGGKKCFKEQFHLQLNGFKSHLDWSTEWHAKRAGNILLVGKKHATKGNSLAKLVLSDDVSKPDAFSVNVPSFLRGLNDGKATIDIPIKGLRQQDNFKHLLSCLQPATTLNANGKLVEHATSPVTIRFFHNMKAGGWYVAISCERAAAPAVPEFSRKLHRRHGAVGVDINPDNAGVCVIDKNGNPTQWLNFPMDLTGSSQQNMTVMGRVTAQIVNLAYEQNLPVIAESLDFKRKKRELQKTSPQYARMLSGFSYKAFLNLLEGRCQNYGVAFHQVNPANTSTIAKFNYAVPHGVSVDMAAACVIARRGLGFKEKLTPRTARVFAPEGCRAVTKRGGLKPQGFNWPRLNQFLPSTRHELYGLEVLKKSSPQQKGEGNNAAKSDNDGFFCRRESVPSQHNGAGELLGISPRVYASGN